MHTAYGHHLTLRGRADDAERELLLARRLDPQYLHSRMHMVNLRITQRRWDQAALEIDALRDLAPGAMPVAGLCGALALFRGDAAAARQHYKQACALQPGGLSAAASRRTGAPPRRPTGPRP
ncbi:hypothetical protein ABXN37_27820 [Piscinibacter sakaiensis]|uniref:tetratricopeptide repeat protein n=1 Tax=Piscinibacter sakaiensis TaxID=1547922 RepID=UPI003726FE83